MGRRYMIGDEYGNMCTGKEDEFQCRIGRVFESEKEVNEFKNMLLNKYSRLEEHVLKVWELRMIDEEDDDCFVDIKPRKTVKAKAKINSVLRCEGKIE